MSKLLTHRLSVVNRNRLKQIFTTCLEFAWRGVPCSSAEHHQLLGDKIKEFPAQTDTLIRLSELSLPPDSIQLWLQCLTDSLYATTLKDNLERSMAPVLQNSESTIKDLWQTYMVVYAHQLLQYGKRVICRPNNLFNQETVRYFITHPEKTHGEELINDIPPLLEGNYIYLNDCGENQRQAWHRDIFLDSYFKALMTYLSIINQEAIASAFNVKLSAPNS